jgi:hypothetical protein
MIGQGQVVKRVQSHLKAARPCVARLSDAERNLLKGNAASRFAERHDVKMSEAKMLRNPP